MSSDVSRERFLVDQLNVQRAAMSRGRGGGRGGRGMLGQLGGLASEFNGGDRFRGACILPLRSSVAGWSRSRRSWGCRRAGDSGAR